MAASTASVLEARNIKKTFDIRDRTILSGVSLAVQHRESVVLTGPSGCGKTTLLSILCGLLPPDSGTLHYRFPDERPALRLTADLRGRHVGIVFQSIHLIATLTALENIEIPMFGIEPDPARRVKRAAEMLEAVDLGWAANRMPHQLSGGERQRVAIARAFVNRPSLVFADEPTGNLDTATADRIMATILSISATTGCALFLVTHDPAIAARVDRRLVLVDGQITNETAVT